MRKSYYPQCCGAYNLSGFTGTAESVEVKLRKYIDELHNGRGARLAMHRGSFLTCILAHYQIRNYERVLTDLGFKAVARGTNPNSHNTLVLYVYTNNGQG